MEENPTNGIFTWKLRKAPKSHWSKIAQYDHTHTTLGPMLDKRTGRPVTGLTKELEAKLEKSLGLDEGTLAPHSKYWRDFQVKLDSSIMTLDLHQPEEELFFYFFKAHKHIAFGEKELKKKSTALYVLYNEVDQAKEQIGRISPKKTAFIKLGSMSLQEQIDVLLVLGEKILSTDPYIIGAACDKLVETRPVEFLEVVEDANFKMKLFILKCLHYDILSKNKGRTAKNAVISFNGDVIADGLDNAVAELNKKTNQPLYLALEKRLDMAQKAGTLAGATVMSGYDIEEALEAEEPKKPKGKRKITSKKDKESIVEEVTKEGTDSGEYGEAPEVL
jgi:hypothetical protein